MNGILTIFKIDKNLLDAWFDILVDYCYNWLKGIKPVYGANFLETKDAIVSSSDIFQDFIDAKLKITTNEKDKIGKDKMKDAFLAMYPDKHLTTTQVMSSLKEHKIKYNMNLRSANNIRGCFYCVKLKYDEDDEDDDDKDKKEDPYEYGVDKTNQSVEVTVSLKKYQDLEDKYNKLLEKLNNQTHELVVTKEDEKPKKIKKEKTVSKTDMFPVESKLPELTTKNVTFF